MLTARLCIGCALGSLQAIVRSFDLATHGIASVLAQHAHDFCLVNYLVDVRTCFMFTALSAFLCLSGTCCSAPPLQAKASLDAVRADAAAEVDQAAQQRDAVIEERDRTVEQVSAA